MLNHNEKTQNSCEGHFYLWMSQGGVKVAILTVRLVKKKSNPIQLSFILWSESGRKLGVERAVSFFLGQLTDILSNTTFLFLYIVFCGGRLNLKSYDKKLTPYWVWGWEVYEVSPSNIYSHKDSYRFYEVKFMSLFGAHNLQIAMFWRAGEK